jgi:KaiC/GvpD/RAD55 family RecA-like ATPase
MIATRTRPGPEDTLKTLLLAETLNAFIARRVITQPGHIHSTSELLRDFGAFLRDRQTWPEWTDLYGALSTAAAVPAYDLPFLLEVVALLLAGEGPPSRQTSDRAKDSLLLPPSPQRVSLTQHLYVLSKNGQHYLSTRPLLEHESRHIGKVRTWSCDQAIDPIALLYAMIGGRHGPRSEERSEYLLQRSLRTAFSLTSFTSEVKYSLASVTNSFNGLFYGTSSPRVEQVQGVRSATISVALLISELAASIGAREDTSTSLGRQLLLQAVGLLYFARACRVLRVRYILGTDYELPGAPSAPSPRRPASAAQCASAIRRLEYGYFLTRIFGSLSEVPGLNFTFRGGILPRTRWGRVMTLKGPPGSGKTVFALQKLCGVAARGGLAVYFSFEERFDLIVDRLVTFGLYERERFEVLQSNEHDHVKVEEALQKGLGVLLLYAPENPARYPLLETITNLGGRFPGMWRALALDSINAIGIEASLSRQGEPTETDKRLVIRNIVETIEVAKFLGLLISEESSPQYEHLDYLADTVLHFGFDHKDRGRWIEIKKCRSQNVHPGRHKLRLVEGEGVIICPSLGAIRSALRRRTKSTISLHRQIVLNSSITGIADSFYLAEKGSVLILTPNESDRTRLVLDLATQPTRLHTPSGRTRLEQVRSIIVLSFKTTEERLMRVISLDQRLQKRWPTLQVARLRWFSPGATLTGDEVVWELWSEIRRARRLGVEVERVVVHEVEHALVAFPEVGRESLFWTTLLQMTSAEAITTFLSLSPEVSSPESVGGGIEHILRSEVDYILSARNADRSLTASRTHEPAIPKGTPSQPGTFPSTRFELRIEKQPGDSRASVMQTVSMEEPIVEPGSEEANLSLTTELPTSQ